MIKLFLSIYLLNVDGAKRQFTENKDLREKYFIEKIANQWGNLIDKVIDE